MDSAWSVLCKGILSESTKRKQRPPGDRSDQVITFEITANAADQQSLGGLHDHLARPPAGVRFLR